jgi:hypothetical protein
LLPVSGIALAVAEPTGDDEVYVIETALPPVPLMAGLASRVATAVGGDPVDWAGLPATDLGATALIIRRCWLGDAIRTDTRCPDPDCRERIDVAFGIGDYIGHHQPRRPRAAAPAPDAADDVGPGWFTLTGTGVRFRVPTIGDLLAAESAGSGAQPADGLARLCIEGAEVSRALARRLDRALSAMAPSLDDLVGGNCPACGREVALRFDPIGYTVADLRGAFSGIYTQAHALAAAYGWPEETILALPSRRRRQYAALIADERWVA